MAITGQVSSASIGTDAFQEADIRGITMPITKHNYLVTDPAQIPRAIAEAFHIASHGSPRPGARRHQQGRAAGQDDVLVAAEDRPARLPPGAAPARQADPRGGPADRRGQRPVLYVGGGVDPRAAPARQLRRFVELTQIPVVTTLMARGAVPDSHPLNLGMPGMHGTVAAVTALQKSDLLITLGARFDDRVTGQLSTFAPDAKVIHADIDPAEISKNRVADVPIVGDCKDVITDLIAAVARRAARPAAAGDYAAWREQVADWKRTFPLGYAAVRGRTRWRRSTSSSASGPSSGPESIFVAGVGQHQMWAAQFVQYERPNALDQLRRPRHHGLLGPGGHGRQGGRARAHGLGHRRRRLLPDDQPGAGDLRHQRHPDQGRDDQQLPASAWCASGRRSSTTSATPTPTCTPPSSAGCPTSSSSPTPTAASACAARRPRTSTPTIAQAHGDQRRARWSSTSSCTVTRWCGRWCRPASATTRSRSHASMAPVWDREED